MIFDENEEEKKKIKINEPNEKGRNLNGIRSTYVPAVIHIPPKNHYRVFAAVAVVAMVVASFECSVFYCNRLWSRERARDGLTRLQQHSS